MQTHVNRLDRIQNLILVSSAIFGGQNKMARAIGYGPGEVSEWANGRRPCPLEAQVLMADAAGLNAQEVMAYAIIERHANTPRGEKLLSALGKVSRAAGVAASCFISASVVWGSKATCAVPALLNTMCSLVKSETHRTKAA